MAKTGEPEPVDRISLELHLPASRQAEGAERCIQDYAALVKRVARVPTMVVSSWVWMGDM